jgi:hypothetical protein
MMNLMGTGMISDDITSKYYGNFGDMALPEIWVNYNNSPT